MEEKTYLGIVAGNRTGSIVTTVTFTPVSKARKTHKVTHEKSPYGEVKKREVRQTHLGVKDYETLVNTHREREGLEADFKAKSTWYTKESPAFGRAKSDGTPVAIFNDEGLPVLETHYFDGNGVELVGDRLADFKENYMPEYKGAYEGQGTEAKVRVRSVKLSNVESITVGGVTYR